MAPACQAALVGPARSQAATRARPATLIVQHVPEAPSTNVPLAHRLALCSLAEGVCRLVAKGSSLTLKPPLAKVATLPVQAVRDLARANVYPVAVPVKFYELGSALRHLALRMDLVDQSSQVSAYA